MWKDVFLASLKIQSQHLPRDWGRQCKTSVKTASLWISQIHRKNPKHSPKTLSQNFTKPDCKIIKCTNKSSLTSLRIDETWTKCDGRQPRTKNNTWSSLCSPSTKSLPTENWPQQGLVVILDSSDIIPSRWRYPETGNVTYHSTNRLLPVFRDVTPYILVNRHQLFGAMYCFYPLGRKVSLTKKMEAIDSSGT